MNDQKLDKLFAEYRQACPDKDPGANFMPGVWARIESRRKSETWLVRWANAFVGAAAVVAIATGVLFYQDPGPVPQRAYIEKLTDEISEDHFLEAGYTAQFKPAGHGPVKDLH